MTTHGDSSGPETPEQHQAAPANPSQPSAQGVGPGDFDVTQYINLDHVHGPALKKDILDHLTYFASKQEGRDLIMQAAERGGVNGRLEIRDDGRDLDGNLIGSAYSRGDRKLNINQQEIATTAYYTDVEKTKTMNNSLGETLLHELEHGRQPDPTEEQFHAAVEQGWKASEPELLKEYEAKHPGSVQRDAKGAATSVSGVPIAEFREQAVELMTGVENRDINGVQPHFTPEQQNSKAVELLMGMSAETQGQLNENIRVPLYETPVIAATNADHKIFYPTMADRVGHGGVIDEAHPHGIDEAAPTPPMQVAPAKPAPAADKPPGASENPGAAVGTKAAHAFAGIDLGKYGAIGFTGAETMANTNAEHAHGAAPTQTIVTQAAQQAKASAAARTTA